MTAPKPKIDIEPQIGNSEQTTRIRQFDDAQAPPAAPRPARRGLNLPDEIPDNAAITLTAKYTKSVDEKRPERPPMPPQMPQMPSGDMRNMFDNDVRYSDNPIQEFLDECDNGEENDIYIQLIRLPDNPISGERYNTPCSSTVQFPPFPFNRISFMTDIQKINGNSGGKFKAIALNDEMRNTGIEMRTVTIPNPVNPNQDTQPQNNSSDFALLLQEMREDRKVLLDAINNKKDTEKSELETLAKDLLLKKLANMDNPQPNNFGGMPTEQQAIMQMMSNPVIAKSAMSTIVGGISQMFATPEKTADTINAGKSVLDRVVGVWESDPEIRKQTMGLASKAIDLLGFGVSKFGSKGNPPRRNPNAQPQQPNEGNSNGQSQAQPPSQQETEYTDAEIIEYNEEQEAIKNAPLTQEILAYLDSDIPLAIDNPFLNQQLKNSPKQTKFTIYYLTEKTFEQAYAHLTGQYPFIEELILEQPRRLERLKEFFELLEKEF